MTIKFFEDTNTNDPTKKDLSWHGMADNKSKMSRTEFLKKLANTPQNIKELNLSANQLGLCDIEFLLTMLERIKNSSHIERLNLSLNKFNKIELVNLRRFLNNIPPNVKELDLNGNQFSAAQLNAVRNTLPSWVTLVETSDTYSSDNTYS